MTKYLYVLAALLALGALGAGAAAVHTYRSMTERVVTLEQTAKDFSDLKTRFDAFSKEVTRRAATDQAIRSNRATTSHELENAAHADKPSADFLATPLPAGLRAAYQRAKEQRVPIADSH